MKKNIMTIIFLLAFVLFFASCENKNDNLNSKENIEEKVYEYSEYFERESLESEILAVFEEYNIRFYDRSNIREFSDIGLPKPETVVVDFPTFEKDSDSYLYKFNEEGKLRAYLGAYMVYIMKEDYNVEELQENIYCIDEQYYIGFGKDGEDYIILIMK